MAWRVLDHAGQRWNVSFAAEHQPSSPQWNLVFSFRGAEPAQRSIWAVHSSSYSSKAAAFAQADRISNQDLVALLAAQLA